MGSVVGKEESSRPVAMSMVVIARSEAAKSNRLLSGVKFTHCVEAMKFVVINRGSRGVSRSKRYRWLTVIREMGSTPGLSAKARCRLSGETTRLHEFMGKRA